MYIENETYMCVSVKSLIPGNKKDILESWAHQKQDIHISDDCLGVLNSQNLDHRGPPELYLRKTDYSNEHNLQLYLDNSDLHVNLPMLQHQQPKLVENALKNILS